MADIEKSNEDHNMFQGDDRRRFQRYQVHHDTMLYNQNSLAEILDISSGGVACRSVVGLEEKSNLITGIELLNCMMGQYVEGLSCRKVRGTGLQSSSRDLSPGQPDCFFEFVGLNSRQEEDLGKFIQTCTRDSMPEVEYGRPQRLHLD